VEPATFSQHALDEKVSMPSYDLHLHTCWSYDALASVSVYFEVARQRGVNVIAITEHHVLDSAGEVQEAQHAYPEVRVIRAAELTVTTSLGAVDLLCYGFPKNLTPRLKQVLDNYHIWQQEYGSGIARGMEKLGYAWGIDDQRKLLQSYRPERTLRVQGRTHVKNQVQRAEWIARGWIQHDDEYWPLVLKAGDAGGAPDYPHVHDVVPALKEARMLVVIAHPSMYFDGAKRELMDRLRVECALDGLECSHRAVPPEYWPVYRAYCLEHALVSTAGTDCHEDKEVRELLGQHGGEEKWLNEFLERLPRNSD
jgi:predicted metal-dependent phosphoesterase TrpH